MVMSLWQSHCESSPSSFDECRLSAEVAANPQTKPTDSDWESARKKWQLPSTSTVAILLLLSPRADTHFTIPREGRRLSQPRHCCKGVQPVPKAVYRSGCRDKHNCPRWDSNLGPLTPQSGMLPVGHCMLPMAVARSSWHGTAIRYVLPVLWMTSCPHIIERTGRIRDDA